jgi:hypothetical protein
MRRGRALAGIRLAVIVLITAQCGTRFAVAPADLEASDLVGTWEAEYWRSGLDRLILRENGTFKQIYRSCQVSDYVYETPWNEWWIDRLQDGRVWLHLEGARYYYAGVRFAEQEGLHASCPDDWPDCRMGLDPPPFGFYDPYGREFVEMIGELVLNVRSDASGALVLHQMWDYADRDFALIGGEWEVFRHVEKP